MKYFRVQGVKDRFNKARNSVRVLTIFSPTCLVCQYGQAVVRELFKEIDAKTVKGFSVWLPVMKGDTEESAQAESEIIPDDRMEHIWDPKRQVGELFAETLKLKGGAWDVYLLYASGITWDTGQPPEPTFWMHQLPTMTGADGKFLLNPGRFSHELLNLLGKGDAHMAWEMAFKLHAKGLDDIKREKKLRPYWRKSSRRSTPQRKVCG